MHCDRLQYNMKLILTSSYITATKKFEGKSENRRCRNLGRKRNEKTMPIIQDKCYLYERYVIRSIQRTCLDSLLASVAAVLRLSMPRETKLSASMTFEMATCKINNSEHLILCYCQKGEHLTACYYYKNYSYQRSAYQLECAIPRPRLSGWKPRLITAKKCKFLKGLETETSHSSSFWSWNLSYHEVVVMTFKLTLSGIFKVLFQGA